MLLKRILRLPVSEPVSLILERLSVAIVQPGDIGGFGAVPLTEWISRQDGKRFVGHLRDGRFKLGLLSFPDHHTRVRGSVVVIVGKVQEGVVQITLRPPLFILGFLTLFGVLMFAGIVLALLGPGQELIIPAVLSVVWVLPFAIVTLFFCREAAFAERVLRQVIMGATAR